MKMFMDIRIVLVIYIYIFFISFYEENNIFTHFQIKKNKKKVRLMLNTDYHDSITEWNDETKSDSYTYT